MSLTARVDQARNRLQAANDQLSGARDLCRPRNQGEVIGSPITRADIEKGAREAVVDTFSGLWNTVTNPVQTAKDAWEGLQEAVDDPQQALEEAWNDFKEPYVEDWENGHPGQAIGRGLVEGGQMLIPGWGFIKGGQKALDILGGLGKDGEAPETPNDPDGSDGGEPDRNNDPEEDDEAKNKYDFPRTPEEYEELARDPSEGNKISPKTERERTAGLTLERQGDLPGPIVRDPTGNAEFIDTTGQKWDVKSFNSNFPERKGGFNLERDLGKIEKEFNQGENVILDTTDLKPDDASALRNAIEQKGWSDRIRWYNP